MVASQSVQSLSRVRLFVTPGTAAHQASLSITNSWSLLRLMSIESVMLCNHLILCSPLLFLPSIFPSIRFFSNELALYITWPKNGTSASASVFPMNIQDWFPLGWTGLISLHPREHHNSKASTVRRSAFFTAQLSHSDMATEKTIALTRRTFVAK